MPSRPDIAILGLNYPPEHTGIAPYTGGLAVGLRRRGFRVEAHVAHPHYPQWKILDGYGNWSYTETIDGVDVHRRLHYVPHPPRGVRRLISELSFGIRLVFARWGRPGVTIAVSPSLFSTAFAVFKKRLSPRRTPLIIWVQDIYSLGMAETSEGGRTAHRITQWTESRTLRSADRVVVIHQRFADFLIEHLGIDKSKVVVVRNWTHLPKTDPMDATAAKAELGWPAGEVIAVHTGNMGAKQGLETIVAAARVAEQRGAPIHFFLVGDGGERAKLQELARGISRLTFVDPLDDAEYRFALCAADVLLVNEKPGVAAMAVPSKLTSYFDAGRPIVAATAAEGITASEVLAADAGIVVRAGAPDELVDAVLAVTADAKAAEQFGRNGRRYRESVLDEDAAVEQWINLIRSLAPNDQSEEVERSSRSTRSLQ
ncbi:glycosyltransferase WbuB [Mycolicibacterium duvalii]|uniref:Glycosyltransferase WbuB n=1 Tax=Mycolicibacterium duvalii TaxID=39688 RepID=A0A7I7K3E2_9MYCO|nr:glycosyltransferase family 4 protein [Mycolicibacterium duvalii]MCV7370636.1 glycosyltransferase family 4 protein [Mycolicibacterium duvalii]PEG36842.1 glycosyltransferase WbuB [Mycolicibacterium duvalii]BBX17981.1 glycosyltransferase WbuB [Mycolicibacterium duvalii]